MYIYIIHKDLIIKCTHLIYTIYHVYTLNVEVQINITIFNNY